MNCEQNGTIILRSNKWYISYWDRCNVNGAVVRKRVTHFLGNKNTRGKYPPPEIKEACARYMAEWNSRNRGVAPELVVPIAKFWQDVYLPWLQNNKRASTVNGYTKIWNAHLREHFGSMLLRDYEPATATAFLTRLAGKMGRNAVANIKSLMSGIFGHAASLGYVHDNPIRLAKTLVAPKAPAETGHYTAREMAQILFVLSGAALMAMALSFIGLRPSEIRGLRWEDVNFTTGILHVCRSAWRGILNPGGKGKRSVREVTLGPTVLNILREHLASHPSRNGFVLENREGRMLDLDYLAQRVIRPALKNCGLTWQGYYAGRRGAETEMNRYTNGNSQVTAHHFGHTKAIADAHHIKPLPDATRLAALALDGILGRAESVSAGMEFRA